MGNWNWTIWAAGFIALIFVACLFYSKRLNGWLDAQTGDGISDEQVNRLVEGIASAYGTLDNSLVFYISEDARMVASAFAISGGGWVMVESKDGRITIERAKIALREVGLGASLSKPMGALLEVHFCADEDHRDQPWAWEYWKGFCVDAEGTIDARMFEELIRGELAKKLPKEEVK